MKNFVLELHLFQHRHKSEFHEHVNTTFFLNYLFLYFNNALNMNFIFNYFQMYQYINKICTVFVDFIHVELFMGIILFTLTPVYNNYMKGMFNRATPVGPDKFFEHSINYSLPYINQFIYDELVSYLFIAILNVLFAYDAGICFGSLDVTLSVIVFHIWGHLKILDHNLRSIPKPVNELTYTAEENKKVGGILKNIVDHHRMIMSFMTNTSDAFGPMLCLYYMFHQVSGCILLLECAELDAKSLTRYGALTVTIFQLLIQISVIVELLGSQSETLKDAVYSVPWECMDTSNRKLVLFLLCNVQEPIRLKPMGIVSVGVQTMATILKTSFSYFMLLRTFD
ncbi:hypothetical protein ABMA27_002896 [Loxostege sticticalis]